MTFREKETRLQRAPARSSRMRLPALGARGSMSSAGVARKLVTTAPQVASRVTPTPSPPEARAVAGSIGIGKGRMGVA